MLHSHKIATCCYCGRRTELVLKGTEMHELSCASCGAPLHNLKHLKTDKSSSKPKKSKKSAEKHAVKGKLPKKESKKRSFKKGLFDELFDIVEDIFD